MSFIRLHNNNQSATSSSSQHAYRELEPTTTAPPRSVMYTRDWRSALRTPPTYRIGNRTVRFNYPFALLIFCVCTLFVIFFYVRAGPKSSSDIAWLRSNSIGNSLFSNEVSTTAAYNSTYPLTAPLVPRRFSVTYRIAIVADLDTNSKTKNDDGKTVWRSYLKKGHLNYAIDRKEIKVYWDDEAPTILESGFALKDRGMELSELVTFNGKLLSFDDRTGLVYELVNEKPIPWVILLDGDGRSAKGFKSEWATVKQQTLYVGSMGKEWTTSMGEFENENPMYVKAIKTTGEVKSIDWSENYKLLRQESDQISWPGYMIHESCVWSDIQKKWYFLPRRCSKEKYNETRDEHMGCNILVSADESFAKIETIPLDPANTKPTHGFSSFKFLPGSKDSIIVAIKSEEVSGKTSTFITAFNIFGKTLLPEQKIQTEYKFEGFEFI